MPVETMFFRTMARLDADLYLRLKMFAKRTGRNVQTDLMPSAVKEYLDKHEE